MAAPDGLDVDHIDGDGLNNQRSNLRVVTRRQNLRNQRRKAANATSQFLGVCWDRSRQRWIASIDGRHIGRFYDEDTAARAYDRAAYARDPEHCALNFPQEMP